MMGRDHDLWTWFNWFSISERNQTYGLHTVCEELQKRYLPCQVRGDRLPAALLIITISAAYFHHITAA